MLRFHAIRNICGKPRRLLPLRVRLFSALQITTPQPQTHSALSSYNKITNLSRRPPSPLSFLASRDLVVARLNHPEYQGLRRTKEGQAFVPSMPLSPIIRASVLSIFRAVQYLPLPQLPSTTTSNAIEFHCIVLFHVRRFLSP